MPRPWIRRAHTREVYDEFSSLFDLRALIWLREFFSVFLLPLVFIFSLPRSADAIVEFFVNYTTYREELGNVCSYSTFEDPRYGDPDYGGDEHGDHPVIPEHPATECSSLRDGKLEKSFLNFYMTYPNWHCPPEGERILRRLAEFRERKTRQEALDRSRLGDASVLAMFGSESAVAARNIGSEAQRLRMSEDLAETHIDFFNFRTNRAEPRPPGANIVELQSSPSPIHGGSYDGGAATSVTPIAATSQASPISAPAASSIGNPDHQHHQDQAPMPATAASAHVTPIVLVNAASGITQPVSRVESFGSDGNIDSSEPFRLSSPELAFVQVRMAGGSSISQAPPPPSPK
jgi:hypothetical protein